MTTLLVSNLCYGERYTALYLDCHLPALLDDSNLPTIKDRVAIECYADQAAYDLIVASSAWQRMWDLGIPAVCYPIPLPSNAHEQRYGLQALTFQRSLHRAFAESRALIYSSADTVYGAGVIPGLLAKIDAGHDAVMGVPMRATSQALADPIKQLGKAMTAGEIYGMGRAAMHPLWMVSHWDASNFSRLPYALLWSDASQVIVRPLTISNLILKVSQAMLDKGPGTPDAIIDSCLTNAYYAENWSELPLIELQGLDSFWPPFRPGPSSVAEYVGWATKAAPAGSIKNLSHAFHFYDAQPSAQSTAELRARSDATVAEILAAAGMSGAPVAMPTLSSPDGSSDAIRAGTAEPEPAASP